MYDIIVHAGETRTHRLFQYVCTVQKRRSQDLLRPDPVPATGTIFPLGVLTYSVGASLDPRTEEPPSRLPGLLLRPRSSCAPPVEEPRT